MLDAEVAEITGAPEKSVAGPPTRRSPSPSYYCSRCQISMSKTRGVLEKGTFTCDECLAMGTEASVQPQGSPGHRTMVTTTCTLTGDQKVLVMASPTPQKCPSPVDRREGGAGAASASLFAGVDV